MVDIFSRGCPNTNVGDELCVVPGGGRTEQSPHRPEIATSLALLAMTSGDVGLPVIARSPEATVAIPGWGGTACHAEARRWKPYLQRRHPE